MTLSIKFDDTRIQFYSGDQLRIRGEARCLEGGIIFLAGPNGSGKTILLSTVAFIYGYPAYVSIHSMEKLSVITESTRTIESLGILYQDPLKNFVGGTLADEFRVIYTNSAYDSSSFKSALGILMSRFFDMDLNILSKDVKQVSSGEKQLIALMLQILKKPDLILLDEPLAHLSRTSANRVMNLLYSHIDSRYTFMAIHPDEFVPQNDRAPECYSYLVERKDHSITIRASTNPSSDILTTNDNFTDDEISQIYLNVESYKLEREDSVQFNSMPENGVRCIHGNGQKLTPEPINMSIYSYEQRRVVTSANGMNIYAGLNLIYGENGAGKTLVAKTLAGLIVANPFMEWYRNGLAARGTIPPFNTSKRDGLPTHATLKWLSRKGHSIYLDAEPPSWFAEDTVRNELESLYTGHELQTRFDWLLELNIEPEVHKNQLSYGQQKLVGLRTMPDELYMAILDEPFSNLALDFQKAVAKLILDQVKSSKWYCVIITTNRPIDTLSTFRAVL